MAQVSANVIRQSGAEDQILRLFALVLAAFDQQNVSYCYWKSSRRIQQALAGDSDVDLLVAREDQYRARRLLLEHGFKPFPSLAGLSHPSITSFLGYDEPSGRIVHIHLHLRLVIGESLLKNYRLPWERVVLARAVRHPVLPIRILDPASEALLLAIRSSVELTRADPVVFRRWTAAQRKFALDCADAAARTDRAAVRELATEFLTGSTADMLIDLIWCEPSLRGRRHLRRCVRRELAPHRTYNALEARLRSTTRAIRWTIGYLNKHSLHLPRPWSRRAPGGGCVVAVVGVDGSGKSTVVAAIRDWLHAEVDVLPIYFGTGGGRPSMVLLPLKLMVPLFMRFVGTKPKGSSHGPVSSRTPGLCYAALLMVWATVLSVEKRIKLLAARRGASRGLVLVADRYPQDETIEFNDAPLLPRLPIAPPWLRRFEAAAYALARHLPPDLVVKLEATAETLATREPDMDPAVIRARIRALRALAFPASHVVRIDAEQPLADVIQKVKREIWRLL